MKKSLTLILVLATLSVFVSLVIAQPQPSSPTSSEMKSAPKNQPLAPEATLAGAGNPMLLLVGLNLSLSGGGASPGGQAIVHVSWTGNSGHTYKLCWKRSNQNGDACNHKQIVDIDASDSNVSISASTWSMVVYADCATAYHFKLKREGALTNDEKDHTTSVCCAVKCPAGGWFDGANCQVGQAPSGTTAFIWDGKYYYTPKPAAPGPRCPLAGSSYDGANCFVKPVPAGVEPFIWLNHWYYKACP
jgi:hypothetical protein